MFGRIGSSITFTILNVMLICTQNHECYVDKSAEKPYAKHMKRNSQQIKNSFAEIGEFIRTWRIIYALKAAQVAERAGISLGTLHKIENGDPSVSTSAFLEVLRSLGLLETLVDSLDPLNHDLGRARVNEHLPRRIR